MTTPENPPTRSFPVPAGADHALIVVDLQHDFADPCGSLYVRGAEEIVAPIVQAIADTRAAGGYVVYTQDWHPRETPHFAEFGGLWPVHCVIGSPGAQMLPGVPVDGPVVRKGSGPEDGYSGFSVRHLPTGQHRETGLSQILDENGIMAITIVGLAGDCCVQETAVDGIRLGYRVTVPLAMTRFVGLRPGDEAAAIARMREAGVTLV